MELHAVQAQFGDCLLLKFDDSKFILIDGGPPGIYEDHLKGQLEKKLGPDKTLEAIIVSHVDNDHIVGILDFLAELKGNVADGESPWVKVKELWMNTFSATQDPTGTLTARLKSVMSTLGTNSVMAHTNIIVQGIEEGHKVTSFAQSLGIKVNPHTSGGFFSVENNPTPINKGSLKLTVIGPTKKNLEELRKTWDYWLEKNETKIANGDFQVAANSDRSVPNLSSLILLAEENGKKFLLTGDCRSDHLVDGLQQSGLLKQGGTFHVDLFKVPHHGSNRNITKTFFRTVTADRYIISADGTYDNPDYDTLQWLVEAAGDDARKIKIFVTNQTDATRQLLKTYPKNEWRYDIEFIKTGESSFRVF